MRYSITASLAIVSAACAEPLAPPELALPPSGAADVLPLQAERQPVDPNFTLTVRPSRTTPDIVIYDLQDGFVVGGVSGSSSEPILSFTDTAIMDAAGEVVLCRIEDNQLVEDPGVLNFYITDAGGQVFNADGQRIYSIRQDKVLEGRVIAATATARIDRMSLPRQLVVMALVAGVCGSRSTG
jgi:hypothetical protein